MIKYFLSREAAQTQRLVNVPGKSHLDLAQMELAALRQPVPPGTDLYDQMFKFGYARVVELPATKELFVDAPKGLSRKQRTFMHDRQSEDWTVTLNSRAFVESRQPAAQLVNRLLGQP